jgi:N-methylhydantoinase A
MRVGIEVGGTFTDLIMVRDGKVTVAKVPSTPAEPDVGAMNALEAAGINVSDVTDLVHGSTVATNAVLERKGGHIGVIVSKGMRDVLSLQRHDRTSIYDLNYQKPRPIVSRSQVCEIDERIGANGNVVVAPDADQLQAQLSDFITGGSFDAIAVCLLNSYLDPAHERLVAKVVASMVPGTPITCSVDVAAEFREYERASTTALAAYVQPIIDRYLNRLVETINAQGFGGRFSIMQSNGGRMPAHAMARNAVSALYSGPAAGVVGAVGIANAMGHKNIITLDMGGTSTDVSLVVGGTPDLAPQTRIDGLPVRTPVIDIVTVGAGGGSIAWVDDGGLLRVGPQSAGAMPGPASYGRGGTLPTVTDAHLIRGTLQARSFLGGTMAVDTQAAQTAYEGLAAQLSMSVEDLADAVIRIAEANIVRAIQQVSTERGHDPRDFVLVPFGGAGSLHAARVAQELGVRTILVPENAGVLSAVGLLASDYVHHRSQTERIALTAESLPTIHSVLSSLQQQAGDYLRSEGIDQAVNYEPVLEMRYVGQAFEVSVPVRSEIASLTIDEIARQFTQAHHRVFEFSKPPDKAVEIVTFRMGVRAPSGSLPTTQSITPTSAPSQTERISITENAQQHSCGLINRAGIDASGANGPWLIEDGTSTIYVPSNWQCKRDETNHLTLTLSESE